MKKDDSYSIGEVARKTGLTERALRFYEEQGLISPARTQGYRRAYDREDLEQLQQVQLLRRAGYSLADIGSLLDACTLNPATVIRLQIAAIKGERDRLSRQIRALEATAADLDQDQEMDVHQLCELIRLGEQSAEQAGWQQVVKDYFSEEDSARWQRATRPLMTEECQQDWAELVARVEKAISAGVAPNSLGAIALAKDWLALQAPMQGAVPGLWQQSAQMMANMEQWSHLARPPFSKAVFDFVTAAVQAGRAQKLLPAAGA
ncbi:MerR family transcriptional regulator [Gallaecimonas kandeliae]|uniref:MerR family transcriptional regulator n=1 Tax=Gallaecimonas kandeliae TaxID=3029055 RepID=UPI0026481971|nr:MerR family transcriptional regulator [Gallaecimonas kandeliae]WKE65023.1 MerR family transcriptional regulator [Gallaecimonas kandeliae]